MDPISLFKQTEFSNTIWWKLKTKVKGFQNDFGYNLVTEILEKRIFRIVEKDLLLKNWEYKSRILIQLYEDGYICWVDTDQLNCEQFIEKNEEKIICDNSYIQSQIPSVLKWIKDQSMKPNKYLWGGTVGPDYDCSGLIQTAFLKHNIFLPRDSYQIQNFCHEIINFTKNNNVLREGDILFFGNESGCNHVAIYFKDGYYYHSSGNDYGRNGIGLDNLFYDNNLISTYYKSHFLSAGRVIRSYRWDQTLR